MWVNLHTLPYGQHMYTFNIIDPDEIEKFHAGSNDFYTEEVDIVRPAVYTVLNLRNEWKDLMEKEGYGEQDESTLMFLADQNTGDVLYKRTRGDRS